VRKKGLTVLSSFLLLYSQIDLASASTVTWNDGDSNWNSAGNWSPSVVPSNGSGNLYDVVINHNTVSLDISPRVSSLTLATPATLNFLASAKLILGDSDLPPFVLTNAGTINITNVNASLTFDLTANASRFGTNTGTIALGAGTLSVSDTLTNSTFTKGLVLNGGGAITMAGGTLQGVSGDEQMFTNNQLQGFGTIQTLQLNLTSGGAITANQAGQTLTVVAPNPPAGIFNSGTMNATSGGTLTLDATIDGSFFTNNSDGVISTNGGTLNLIANGGSGPSTSMFNNGQINIADGDTFNFVAANGSNGPYVIQNNGTINIGSTSGASLFLDGSNSNDSTAIFDLQVTPGVGASTLTLADSATISGSASQIIGVNGNEELLNDSQHTITGAGTISAPVQNNGTIVAVSNNTTTPNPLFISDLLNYDGPSGSLLNGSFVADGTKLEIGNAVGAQGLVTNNASITLKNGGLITNNVGSDIVSGSLTTNNGSLNLINTTLNLTHSLGFTNGAGGSISIDAMSTFDVSAGAFTNIDGSGVLKNLILTDSGTFKYNGNDVTKLVSSSITLDGSGQFLNLNGVSHNALTTLNSIDAASSLSLNGGASLTLSGALNNAGNLIVGDTITPSTLTAPGFTNSGFLSVNAGSTADFRGGTFGSLSGGTLAPGTYSVFGKLQYTGGQVVTNNAIVTIGVNGVFHNDIGLGQDIFSGALAVNNGTIDVANYTGGSVLTTPGSYAQGNGAALTLRNGSAMHVNGSFTNGLSSSAGVTLLDGSSLTITGALDNSPGGVITLSGTPSTLTANGFNNGINGQVIVDAGTMNVKGAGNAAFQNLSGGTLTGGTYRIAGTFQFGGDALGNSAATVSTIATNTSVQLGSAGWQFLNGNGANALATVSTNNGTFQAYNGASLTLNGGLTNSITGNLDVGLSTGGGTLHINGALVNNGLAEAQVGSTLTASGLTNAAGATLVLQGSTGSFQGPTNNSPFTNLAADGTLTGGSYAIRDSTFQFGGDATGNNTAGIVKNSATVLELNGVTTQVLNGSGLNALTGLAANTTILQLDGGFTLATNTGFENFAGANLSLNQAIGSPATQLTVGGTLKNDAGAFIDVTGPSTLNASAFTNNGSITVLHPGESVANVGNFNNLNSSNVLTGGTYLIGGLFEFSNTNTINELGSSTSLELTNTGFSVQNATATSNSALATFQKVDSGATFKMSSLAVLNVGAPAGFTNNGTTTIDFSTLNVTNGPLVNNSVMTLSDGLVTSAGLTNNGTLNLNSGTHTVGSFLDASISGGAFTNLDALGNLTGGTYNMSSNDPTHFSILKYSGSVDIVNIKSGTSLTLSDNSLIANASGNALAALASNAGSLTTVNGFVLNTPGAFTNTGSLTVGTGTNSNLSTFSTTTGFTNGATGLVTVQEGGELSTGTNFTNQTGGTVTVKTIGSLSTAGNFLNQGGATVNVSQFGSLDATGQFVNSGTANISFGGSVVSAGLNNSGGILNLTNGGTLNTGTFSNLDGSGNLAGGTYNLSGASQMSYGSAVGIVNIGAGTSVTLSDTSAILSASGSANALASLASNAGSLTIEAGYNISTPGAFANSGTLMVGSGSTFHAGGNYTETAGLTQVDGALSVNSANNIQIQGGTLKGTGTITGDVSNSGTGTIAPGDSPGILNITGGYSQAGADLLIQIAGNTPGTGYSELNVSGAATLNGEIEFDFISFVPDATMYHVLLYGSHSGAFTSTVIDNLSGYTAHLNYTPTELDVTFSNSGVPEPSTLGMALIGLLAAWIGLRRQFKYKNSLVDIKM
jgi:fibronectin-binding autotransporter adhesin